MLGQQCRWVVITEAAMRQLLLPHSVLIADLKPACEGCMAEGDLIAMHGGVVHARPAM